MASVTQLGFNIHSRYNGAGMRAARRDIQGFEQSMVRIARFQSALRMNALSAFRGLVVATAPALITLGRAALFAAGQFTAMAVSAGSAFAIWGGVMVAAAKRAFALEAAGKKLNSAQKGWIKSVHGLTRAWNKFLDRTSGKTLEPATIAVNALRRNIGKLAPVLNAMHPVMKRIARAFASWMDRSDGFKRFIGTVTKFGVPAFNSLAKAARHVLGFLGHGFRAFAPEGVKMANSIRKGALALHLWAKQGGFQRFIARVKQDGPTIRAFFSALGGALGQVFKALDGMALPAMKLATALLRIVAALPVGVIQALVYAYIAWKLALVGVVLWQMRHTLMLIIAHAQIVICRVAIWAIVAAQWAYTIATKAAAVATRLLAIAFRLTPVGLIITAIVAIVAAIVWLATKTRFFQKVWKAIWGFVKRYAIAVWKGLVKAWRFTVSVFMGLFRFLRKAIPGAWRAVWGFVKRIASNVWGWLRGAWRATTGAIRRAWKKAGGWIKGAWNAVWGFVKRLAKRIWDWLKGAWRAVVNSLKRSMKKWSGWFRGAWRFIWGLVKRVARNAWGWLKGAWRLLMLSFRRAMKRWSGWFRGAWRFIWGLVKRVARDVWNWLKSRWRGLLNFMRGIFKRISSWIRARWRGLWGGIKSITKSVSDWIRDKIKNVLDRIRGYFRTAVKWIGNKWDDLRGILKKPINFFINTVYNNGLRRAWNATVAKIPGVPDLPKAPGMARGGKVRGAGGATQDNVPIMASAGEYVIRRKVVKTVGVGYLDQLNRSAAGPQVRTGSAGAPMRGKPTLPQRFDLGGLIGGIVGKAANFAKSALGLHNDGPLGKVYDWGQGIFQSVANKVATSVIGPFIDKAAGIDNRFKDAGEFSKGTKTWVVQGFNKLISYIFSIAKPDMMGGANVGKALKWAKRQEGKPYSLGAFGGAFDCSSFMSGITQIINGNKPSRMFTTHPFHSGRSKVMGFQKGKKSPFEIGITGAGIGHTAGTLGGVNVEATPPRVRVGKNARGSRNGMFRHTYGHIGAAQADIKGGIGVKRWKSLALKAMRMGGISTSQIGRFLALMWAESKGNPRAINNSDINARNNNASRGLMQVIPTTFRANHVRGTSNNIYDPLANMAAAARYIKRRYGGRVPGSPYALGGMVNSFDNGGFLPRGLSLAYNGTGAPEPVGHGLGGEVHLHFHGNVYTKSRREFEDMVVDAVSSAEGKGRIRTRSTRRGA